MGTIKRKIPQRKNFEYARLNEDRFIFLMFGLDLLDGFEANWKDEHEARQCWQVNSKIIMERFRKNHQHLAGRRFWGWWEYESPEPRNKDEDETAQLKRLGVLEAWELNKLIEWNK